MKLTKVLATTAILTFIGFPNQTTVQLAVLRVTKKCPDCDLRWVNLSHIDLAGADLRNADLRGAKLQFVSLNNADLRAANLKGAQLKEVSLEQANLCGAILPNGTKFTIEC